MKWENQPLTEFPEIFAISEKASVAKSLIFLTNKLAPLVTSFLFVPV